jgi:methylase of polypeptide subunit release factors
MEEIFTAQKKLWDTQHHKRRSEHKDIADTPNEFARKCLKYIPENAKILELGAASGRDARFFARERKNCKVFALDFSLTALEHLQEDAVDDGTDNFIAQKHATQQQ